MFKATALLAGSGPHLSHFTENPHNKQFIEHLVQHKVP